MVYKFWDLWTALHRRFKLRNESIQNWCAKNLPARSSAFLVACPLSCLPTQLLVLQCLTNCLLDLLPVYFYRNVPFFASSFCYAPLFARSKWSVPFFACSYRYVPFIARYFAMFLSLLALTAMFLSLLALFAIFLSLLAQNSVLSQYYWTIDSPTQGTLS